MPADDRPQVSDVVELIREMLQNSGQFGAVSISSRGDAIYAHAKGMAEDETFMIAVKEV